MASRHRSESAEEQQGRTWSVHIRFGGPLEDWMGDSLQVGCSLAHPGGDRSALGGELPDTPALYGLILRLRDSGIEPVALCAKCESKTTPGRG